MLIINLNKTVYFVDSKQQKVFKNSRKTTQFNSRVATVHNIYRQLSNTLREQISHSPAIERADLSIEHLSNALI